MIRVSDTSSDRCGPRICTSARGSAFQHVAGVRHSSSESSAYRTDAVHFRAGYGQASLRSLLRQWRRAQEVRVIFEAVSSRRRAALAPPSTLNRRRARTTLDEQPGSASRLPDTHNSDLGISSRRCLNPNEPLTCVQIKGPSENVGRTFASLRCGALRARRSTCPARFDRCEGNGSHAPYSWGLAELGDCVAREEGVHHEQASRELHRRETAGADYSQHIVDVHAVRLRVCRYLRFLAGGRDQRRAGQEGSSVGLRDRSAIPAVDDDLHPHPSADDRRHDVDAGTGSTPEW